MSFSNIRYNGVVGVVEYRGLVTGSLHFAEWWNGEGLDYEINSSAGDTRRIQLHFDELHAMIVAAIATGSIDIRAAAREARTLKADSLARAKSITPEKYI